MDQKPDCAKCVMPNDHLFDCKDCHQKVAASPQQDKAQRVVSDDLLSATADKAKAALNELAEVFRAMGVYHYEEMVRSQRQAISGAVIVTQNALGR